MLNILFLSICYTITFYASTLLGNYFSPLLMIGARGLISGLLLLAIHRSCKKRIRTNIRQHKYQYFYAIFFGFIAPFALTALFLNNLPMVDTNIIATVEPILTYLFAAYFFKERLNKKQVLFLFLGTFFAFIAIIIEAELERVTLISWQEPLVLLVATILAIGWLAITKLVSLNEPEDAIVGIGLLTTGIIATTMSIHLEKTSFSIEAMSLVLFLLVILFGDLIVTRMRVKLSKKYSATLLSLICIFVPFITALHQEIFKHQHYSYKFFLILIPSLICFIAFYHEEIHSKKQES